ncbi:hypothetical protein Hypma_010716 [Hypsizygus marmoreus]|uniref:Uncharacterized protein n=1 Tax=Hypsizygus marmoreus TaxID=39966 RepID=A0A369JLA9_HYPMA|nr:hypothetical protein Hypma_010716 [Hypsizygus marmoreus]
MLRKAHIAPKLEDLYHHGARSFLFLTVPPTDRALLFLQQGRQVVNRLNPLIANYNKQLSGTVVRFQARHRDLDQVTVFDTQPIFNILFDSAKELGFVNSTGWCEAYQNGTPQSTTQIAPCAPVSSYLRISFFPYAQRQTLTIDAF